MFWSYSSPPPVSSISYVPPDIPNSHILHTTWCTQLHSLPMYYPMYPTSIKFFLLAPPHKMTIKTKSKAIGQKLPKQKQKAQQTKPNETWNHGVCTESWAWGPPWCVINILSNTPLGGTDLSFLSRYQFRIASWLWVDLGVYFPSQCGDCVWFEFVQGFLCVLSVSVSSYMTQPSYRKSKLLPPKRVEWCSHPGVETVGSWEREVLQVGWVTKGWRWCRRKGWKGNSGFTPRGQVPWR